MHFGASNQMMITSDGGTVSSGSQVQADRAQALVQIASIQAQESAERRKLMKYALVGAGLLGFFIVLRRK